ncbi:hypothetical protein So717_03530 [Roseobacter cerasinus]|uniref:Uncharacterized protein n=1 Tax=Roseobacter cerasinus TaxID=2602289 RepID=A0A640VMF9_9RHOB|nr:hypothetical protein So717_03530 [Roseobacter cerasinus]
MVWAAHIIPAAPAPMIAVSTCIGANWRENHSLASLEAGAVDKMTLLCLQQIPNNGTHEAV